MNYLKKWIWPGFICAIACLLSFQVVLAGDIVSNDKSHNEIIAIKKVTDDPTPIFKEVNYFKDWVTKETWDAIAKDPEEHKRAWEKAVGFKAPDVTGTIAPEIKPGKYTLADKERLPFKELMHPHIYARFNEPGAQGKNLGGNFTEFEVIPTRQLYVHYNTAMNTIKYEGKARQFENGYPDKLSYEAAIPFPKPSGPHAGWQVVANMDQDVSRTYEDLIGVMYTIGIDRSLRKEREGMDKYYLLRTSRRSVMEPFGKWYDARAERLQEASVSYYFNLAPRDVYGTGMVTVRYDNTEKPHNYSFYSPLLRRIRKWTASDTQDTAVGLDICMDDDVYLNQSLTPNKYPYEVKILEEREYLMPSYTIDGEVWVDSKNKFLWRNLKMERRPVYVVEMKQLDPNYVYSKRVYLVDKENFLPVLGEYYDQNNRLWRSMQGIWGFTPETGCYTMWWTWMFDHIDEHSSAVLIYEYPAENMDRKELTPRRLMQSVK